MLEKMKVSKLVKQYIVSIDEETKEYFGKTTQLILESVKKDIFGTPLVSSNKAVIPIIEKHVKDAIYTSISIVDYYVEGIYNSGKLVSRKKLKLQNPPRVKGEKYSFTQNDKLFIDKYKSHRLSFMTHELTTAIVDYLSHLISSKINSEWDINEYNKQELVDDEMVDILKLIKDSLDSIYDEFFETIVRELIVLFKRAQLEEFNNLGINTVTFFSIDESSNCPVCNAKSGKIFTIDSITTDLGLKDGSRHAFCKFTIDPVISYKNQVTDFKPKEFGLHSEYDLTNDIDLKLNPEIKTRIDFEINKMKFINAPIEVESRINNVIKKLQIYVPQYLKEYEFKFIDNIADDQEWLDSVKNHYIAQGKNEFEASTEALRAQDNLKFSIATFTTNNRVLLSPMSLDSQPIENLILREIFKSQLTSSKELDDLFKDRKDSKYVGNGVAFYKKQFISYLAEESVEDYLIESVISYIISPNKLKVIDEGIYKYIKDNVFDSIEF